MPKTYDELLRLVLENKAITREIMTNGTEEEKNRFKRMQKQYHDIANSKSKKTQQILQEIKDSRKELRELGSSPKEIQRSSNIAMNNLVREVYNHQNSRNSKLQKYKDAFKNHDQRAVDGAMRGRNHRLQLNDVKNDIQREARERLYDREKKSEHEQQMRIIKQIINMKKNSKELSQSELQTLNYDINKLSPKAQNTVRKIMLKHTTRHLSDTEHELENEKHKNDMNSREAARKSRKSMDIIDKQRKEIDALNLDLAKTRLELRDSNLEKKIEHNDFTETIKKLTDQLDDVYDDLDRATIKNENLQSANQTKTALLAVGAVAALSGGIIHVIKKRSKNGKMQSALTKATKLQNKIKQVQADVSSGKINPKTAVEQIKKYEQELAAIGKELQKYCNIQKESVEIEDMILEAANNNELNDDEVSELLTEIFGNDYFLENFNYDSFYEVVIF